MSYVLFFSVLLAGWSLVFLQGLLAHRIGYFFPTQMVTQKIQNGYAFIEMGNMWADVLLITPLIAFIVSRYHLPYTAWWSWLIFIAIVIIFIPAKHGYNEIGMRHPIAHNYLPISLLHGIFAAPVAWVLILFYFAPTMPKVTSTDLGIALGAMTFFIPLALVDFNRNWEFLAIAKIQILIGIPAVWIITFIRLVWF